EREDLEAAAVGEERPRPAHERVQPAELRDLVGTRLQREVVGVGEADPGAGLRHLRRRHALDGGERADRHEGRSRDRRARQRELAEARAGRILLQEPEGVGHGATIAAPVAPDASPAPAPAGSRRASATTSSSTNAAGARNRPRSSGRGTSANSTTCSPAGTTTPRSAWSTRSSGTSRPSTRARQVGYQASLCTSSPPSPPVLKR